MAIDTMKKGSIEMLVLFLLCEGDAYGYQLAQQIKERSGGVLSVQEGSFYPLLYRLVRRALHHGQGDLCEDENRALPHADHVSSRACRPGAAPRTARRIRSGS